MADKNTSGESVKALKTLKKQLNRGKISVLLGSGFSKNVSSKFPNWSELLHDLVFEMYRNEIEYKLKTSGYRNAKDADKNSIKVRQHIEEIIKREGYLTLVSEYIKRKGFRETIDAYIEEHIPVIDKTDKNSYFLKYIHSNEKNQIPLQQSCLDLHKKLIKLSWNNIFTTNYDNAIECAYEDDKAVIEQKNEQLEKLKEQKSKNEFQISQLQAELKKVKTKSVSKESSQTNIIEIESDDKIFRSENEITGNLESLEDENMKLESEIELLKTSIDDEKINIVKQSSELEIQKNRNIIKLHGSLPEKNEKHFGFDGDIHKRYVISKEDYENYPEKHEAFTQLMRISLLQDSFCLIGFSGIDPNFIAWINWVRDIIEKKPSWDQKENSEGVENNYKIYLIDVENEKLTAEKELFFANHRIVRIPLNSAEITDFLQTFFRLKTIDSGRNILLDHLFSYLATESSQNIERERNGALKLLWEELGKIRFGKTENISKLQSAIDKLWRLKSYSRVNKFDTLLENLTSLFLSNIKNIYSSLNNSENASLFYKLLILILNDSYLIYSDRIIPSDIYKELNENVPNEHSPQIKILELREAVLLNKTGKIKEISNRHEIQNLKDQLNYEKALNFAFNFDFTNLTKHLHTWNPTGYFVVLKASLLAILNVQDAHNTLSSFIYNTQDFPLLSKQEKLNAYSLNLVLKTTIDFRKNDELHSKINKLRKQDCKDHHENIASISKQLKSKNSFIQPFGRGEFEAFYDFSQNENLISGIQFIQYLIQTGLPLEIQFARTIDYNEWYPAFKTLYEKYPYPALFFSLQYQNEGFIKRIGQDFVNSDILYKELPNIFRKLTKAYFSKSTPEKIKTSILYFLSELLIAVPPAKWEKDFIKYWKYFLNENLLFNDSSFPVHAFVKSALKYLETGKIVEDVIRNLIENREKGSLAVNYVYTLTTNKTISRVIAYLQTSQIPTLMDEIIFELPENFIYNMYIIGNLGELLTSNQKNNLEKKLELVNLKKFDNYNVWHIILHYSGENEKIKSNIKKAIIQSKHLFISGITIQEDGRKSATHQNYIELHNLKKNKYRHIGLSWAKQEAEIIFNKLRAELNKIDQWGMRARDIVDFKDLLDEMSIFLTEEKELIKDLPDYNGVTDKVQELLTIEKGKGELLQRLMSNNNDKYFFAIEDLTRYLFRNLSVGPFHDSVDFILSKVTAKAEPNLLFTLRKVAIWLRELKNDNCLNNYGDKLCLILESFKSNKLGNCYKPSYHLYLTTIALVLKYWDIKHPSINYWLTQKELSHFNNVKQIEI
jgi:hypothetical protein